MEKLTDNPLLKNGAYKIEDLKKYPIEMQIAVSNLVIANELNRLTNQLILESNL